MRTKMKETIEDICFWKKNYGPEKEKWGELGKSFEECLKCEGKNASCENYFIAKDYTSPIKEKTN